ncbi:hypothetical protein RUM44_011205 [Polyplax serrata]|uniref:Uncharacterized protein n=1 Tax=Polyplax serrata TaxID=468196 RepID=A0ABR1APH8_POLSC
MFTKVLVRELDSLKASLSNIRAEIAETIAKKQSVEAEYEIARSNNQEEMINLGKIILDQQYKDDQLDEQEADINFKISSLNLLISEFQASSREDTDELQKNKADNSDANLKTTKTIETLKRTIDKEKMQLEIEEEYLAEIQKNYENQKQTRAAEFKAKLESARTRIAERLKVEEAKYRSKREPLLFKIKCLDENITELEKEISLKPKEQEDLKKRHDMLLKQLAKATAARYVYSKYSLLYTRVSTYF